MSFQEKTKSIQNQIKELISTFVEIASKHTTTIMPGMTHLQHAQPINFGFHMMAYANMFKRDFERFESSYERNNYCPLGSAALAGTPHNINRDSTSQKLGFIAPTSHAMDTVSDRDFALEILFNISTCMMHISRIAEELILWSSYEFQFVRMSDEYKALKLQYAKEFKKIQNIMNLGSSFKNIAVVFDVVMFLSSFLDFHDEEIIDCLQISKIRITSKLR